MQFLHLNFPLDSSLYSFSKNIFFLRFYLESSSRWKETIFQVQKEFSKWNSTSDKCQLLLLLSFLYMISGGIY